MKDKLIYSFGNGKSDGDASKKDVLGGKGANLAEMSKIGIPVPSGFTISTSECNRYYENGGKTSDQLLREIDFYIEELEKESGFEFGSKERPLLVSVRSGAKFSMPGMMDTILNLGLNDKTVVALARLTNNERFAYDSYRRFIQMYSDVVLEVDHYKFETILDKIKNIKNVINDSDLLIEDLKEIIERYKEVVKKETGFDFEQDTKKQLILAIEAVFKSWMNERAITYRKINEIPNNCGTAVNIQSMVFGNMGSTSATGVAFTRNPTTGDRVVYGEYLINAQGEDVVSGIRTPNPLLKSDGDSSLEEKMPETFQELMKIFNILESHYKDMQDVEFTIQEGKLWILQTRNGKRVTKSAVKIAIDMMKEGLISEDDVILRIDPNSLNQLLHPVLDRSKKINVIARGLPASPGAVSGKIVFNSRVAEDAKRKGIDVILVRNETSPEDIGGMHASVGILTARGGMTSHAAVVARGMGKCCISGCDYLKIDYENETVEIKNSNIILKRDDVITLDGSTGEIILGKAETIQGATFSEFTELMEMVDKKRKIKVRANAETPLDCNMAIKFGADGIGLCRTEHMFFEKDRILEFRRMILSDDKIERLIPLQEISKMQILDFIEIFKIMNGLPVNIRLLDPPLHEFLPHTEDEINVLCDRYTLNKEVIRYKISLLHEQNPMLGHRGSRLGISYPEIFEMQIRAIFNAAVSVKKEFGIDVNVEIMLPIIIEKKELFILSEMIKKINSEICDSDKIKFKIGTMIEIPRACIVADEIAEVADYFSFGTNDLTQTTLGISRDDAGRFLDEYISRDILEEDPFVSIDKKGVGELMKIAIDKARNIKKDISISVCGEHGGDPKSIQFFSELDVSYVSCSPYRIPIAKLALARAEVLKKLK